MTERQTLKKEDCNHDCPRCNVLNLAQRRAAEDAASTREEVLAEAATLEGERCPPGVTMDTSSLQLPRARKTRRRSGW